MKKLMCKFEDVRMCRLNSSIRTFTHLHIRTIVSSLIVISLFLTGGCKKDPSYLYQVNATDVVQDGGKKNTVKSTTEFISIAYSDIFGKEIPNNKLVNLNTAYLAFGDKKLIEDMIIRNFLNDNTNVIPTKSQMRDSISQFVASTYNKLLNRSPNEFEKYFVSTIIKGDTSISPVMFYYAIMTSNEYRYY